MNREGPELATLLRRMVDCPPAFLAEPADRTTPGRVVTAALIHDLVLTTGGAFLTPGDLEPFLVGNKPGKTALNHLQLVHLAVWLLHDPWFLEQRIGPTVVTVLARALKDIAKHVRAAQILADPERREEFVRLILKALGLRPQGETLAQAEDRLGSIDTVGQVRLLKEARQREKAREEQIRQAAQARAAQEAASTYGRE